MKCPHDGTELAKVEILGVGLDKCHKCDGLWCDRGELERLRDAAADGTEEVLERKYGDPAHQEGRPGGYMLCPRCGNARLQRQRYTYKAGVSVDRCEKCLGIWLDDTELNAIIGEKKSLEEDETQVKGFLARLIASVR